MTNLTDNKLPAGKYTFVGVDIDSTGRRILDEIVHLSAYTPKSQFDQYIIPLMNLNPAARQRHQLRIITVGFFRMLKCILTNKVMKSKTEITALRSFLEWLEERKLEEKDSKGIVLIYHEPIKFIPFMLLEAFKRYDLLDRFSKVVIGFVDGHALATAKCATSVKYSSIRQMAKLFVDVGDENDLENFEGNAAARARLGYQILQHLAKDEKENADNAEITADLVQGYVHSIKHDINELSNQNKCMELQHTFRPVFVNYFKTNLFHRYKAVTFRRVLSEQGYDLSSLECIWNQKHKEGIKEIVVKLDEIKEENRDELVDILDSYFDPEKEAIVPVVKKSFRGRRRYKKDKENRNGMPNEPSTPDSTTRSPRKARRSRRRFNSRRNGPKDSGKNIIQAQNDGRPQLAEIAVGGN